MADIPDLAGVILVIDYVEHKITCNHEIWILINPRQSQDENLRSGFNEEQDDIENTSGDLQDEETGEPVLDEEDMEEKDLTDDELDAIDWDDAETGDEDDAVRWARNKLL